MSSILASFSQIKKENHMNKKMNFLFILSDDQGAWALHSAGNADVITPNLDELAREGNRFENFF